MNKEEILNKLKEYNLDSHKFIIIGSAALVLNGIKEACHDIDIAVTKEYNDFLLNNFKCDFEREIEGHKKDQKDIELILKYLNNLNMNSLALAYLGDATYELYIRKYLTKKGNYKVKDLQTMAVDYVSAKAQSNFLDKMIENNFLTEDELDIVKRARNHKVLSHPKNTSIIVYKKATGLEALLGFLELNNNKQRINEIMKYIVGD